jgi:CheY-like chemotaxis protein
MSTPVPATPRAPLVFVADDDADQRTAVRMALEQDGCDVVEACDGDEALAVLAAMADAPDVILLDFCMPGFSGLGVLRLLRRLGRIPPTYIVTAFRDESVSTLAERFGAAGVLYKPVDLDELCAAVRTAAKAA